MSVPVWASDADYSPPASVGASQATKVQPSAGAIAQGLIPGAYNAAQRLNWLLNALCNLANTNEAGLAAAVADIASNLAAITSNDADIAALQALVDARSLQAAYARSIALGQTSPTVNVDNSIQIGTTAVPFIFGIDSLDNYVTMNAAQITGTLGVSGALNALGDLDAGDDVDLGALSQLVIDHATGNMTVKLANLRINGGGSGQRALIHDGSGVASDLPLASGTWTPAATAVSGTGAVVGNLGSTHGRYQRVGNVVSFAWHGSLASSGWGGNTWTFDVPLPVSTTHADANALSGQITIKFQGQLEAANLYVSAVSGTNRHRINIENAAAVPTPAIDVYVAGQYLVA